MNIAKLLIQSITMYSFFAHYQWYRKAHGGRWEQWWIPICAGRVWLRIDAGVPDDHRQPCSEGPRLAREDYP